MMLFSTCENDPWFAITAQNTNFEECQGNRIMQNGRTEE